MKFFTKIFFGGAILAAATLPMAGRADIGTNAMPDFKEVYDLVRQHLSGESESELNREAVEGLLQQLHSKVSLVNGQSAPEPTSNAQVLKKSSLYDGPVGYLRVGHVSQGLANQISGAFRDLNASNHLKGLVIDLRFADGTDYAEAAAVADLFTTKEMPLLDWGRGVVQSKTKPDAIALPVAVLINSETEGAAEALAAVLRAEDRAVLIGSTTAGKANMSQEFPLKDGRYLRIATEPVKLGNGQTLAKGVSPDIQVQLTLQDERVYYQDPFKELPSTSALVASIVGDAGAAANGTNHQGRTRQLNEAELMRERKANPGVELDGSTPQSDTEQVPEKPVIHDPALGRGLDLVKGLSVMRKARTF